MLFVWAYFCTHTHGFPFFLFYPDRKKTIAAGQIAFLFANPLFILLTLALYPSHACACARLFARGVKQQKIKCRKHVIVGFVQSFVHYTTVSDSRRTKDFIVPDAFWRKNTRNQIYWLFLGETKPEARTHRPTALRLSRVSARPSIEYNRAPWLPQTLVMGRVNGISMRWSNLVQCGDWPPRPNIFDLWPTMIDGAKIAHARRNPNGISKWLHKMAKMWRRIVPRHKLAVNFVKTAT